MTNDAQRLKAGYLTFDEFDLIKEALEVLQEAMSKTYADDTLPSNVRSFASKKGSDVYKLIVALKETRGIRI